MISTKDIKAEGGSSVQKVLQPGNQSIKINAVTLARAPWSSEGYNLVFACEGPDMGDSFEGFFIDKNNEAAGRHKGQVGSIRSSKWLYESKIIEGKAGKDDIEIDRDLQILQFLKNTCEIFDCAKWLTDQDGKFETIEGLVESFNADKPFANKFVNACLCGKQYESKSGYTNYDLFFPKFTRNGVPFELEDVEPSLSQVCKFNEKDHIVAIKPKAVESFTSNGSSSADDGFEL